MTESADSRGGDAPPACVEPECERDGAFWCYDKAEDGWRPLCAVHARHHHPSIEVAAWLASGYMRPVERGRPDGRPPEPELDRGRIFREEIDELLGWSEGE